MCQQIIVKQLLKKKKWSPITGYQPLFAALDWGVQYPVTSELNLPYNSLQKYDTR